MADLVSVVVGAVLAVGGGATTQWYLHRLKSDEERRMKRQLKFEEIIAALYDHQDWLNEIERRRVFGEDIKRRVSPLAKIRAIAAVHFPEANGDLGELTIATHGYEQWMLAKQTKRLAKEPVDTGDIGPVYGAYNEKLNAAIQELIRLATV